MAINNPKESPKKKRVVLPDPIKFLEDLVQPLDQGAMDSPVMQPIMGYLGPPGHVPPITASKKVWPQLVKALEEAVESTRKNGFPIRTIKNIEVDPRRSASFEFFPGQGTLVAPGMPGHVPLSWFPQAMRHETIHGLDRAALEQSMPSLIEKNPIRYYDVSEVIDESMKRGGNISPERLKLHEFIIKMEDAATRAVKDANKSSFSSPLYYGSKPLSNRSIPLPERVASFGSMPRYSPPEWQKYIDMLKYLAGL